MNAFQNTDRKVKLLEIAEQNIVLKIKKRKSRINIIRKRKIV